MKTFKNGTLSFGLGAVNVAKRNAIVEPELIINPTVGAFRATPPISRALGITNGGYIMFVSNVDAIESAIAQKDEDLVAFCAEEGIDMETPDGVAAIHKAFDQWGIAKGIQMFDAKGNPVLTKERMTKSDKIEYVTNNFEDVLAAAKNSGNEELIASLEVEGITQETQIEILAGIVNADEINKYFGSKCSNSSNLSGIGVVLTFSDAAVWSALKADLGEDAKNMNRIYSVDVKDLQEVVYNDGCKDVTIKAAMLTEYRDETPTRGRNANKEEDGKQEVVEKDAE